MNPKLDSVLVEMSLDALWVQFGASNTMITVQNLEALSTYFHLA